MPVVPSTAGIFLFQGIVFLYVHIIRLSICRYEIGLCFWQAEIGANLGQHELGVGAAKQIQAA